MVYGCTMTVPVIPFEQCSEQKYGKVPALVNMWLYVASLADRLDVEQLVLLGEQNLLSALQLSPLVTEWLPLSHVHNTVSPTWIVTEAIWKVCTPLAGPTCTTTVCGPPEHAPLLHVAPAAHAKEDPHPPQFAGSLCSSTHAPPHALKFASQPTPHDDPSHVAVPCRGVGHAEHDAPQVAMEALLTQLPLQSCVVPAAHLHWPLWQVLPPAHAKTEPHPPQFALSICSLTQPPLHGLYPLLHDVPHDVPSHVACALVGAKGQEEHEEPHVAVDALLAHVPAQSCVVPAAHLH